MTRLIPVPLAAVPTAWAHVSAWVAAALCRGNADHAAPDVREHLDRGTMQLWLIWDGPRPVGCVVTELIESARRRACNLVIVAGERFPEWAHVEADIARWARSQGCGRLTLTGRKGWVRRLAGAWTETAVTLERQIDGQQQPEDQD